MQGHAFSRIIVRRARELREKGLTVRRIARKLGVSKSAVDRWTRDLSGSFEDHPPGWSLNEEVVDEGIEEVEVDEGVNLTPEEWRRRTYGTDMNLREGSPQLESEDAFGDGFLRKMEEVDAYMKARHAGVQSLYEVVKIKAFFTAIRSEDPPKKFAELMEEPVARTLRIKRLLE